MNAFHLTVGAFALACVADAAVAAAPPASATRFVPAPGLYKIEDVHELTASGPGGSVQRRTTTDPSSGDVDATFRRQDGSGGRFGVAGDGPQQVCIKPVKAARLPAGIQLDGCNAAQERVVGERLVANTSCPWGKVATSTRRIDARTWETTTDVTFAQDPAGAMSATGHPMLHAMAEQMAKEGSAEDRAAARRYLEEAKKAGAQQKIPSQAQLPPEVAAAMKSAGVGARTERSVQRLTRIGDCKG